MPLQSFLSVDIIDRLIILFFKSWRHRQNATFERVHVYEAWHCHVFFCRVAVEMLFNVVAADISGALECGGRYFLLEHPSIPMHFSGNNHSVKRLRVYNALLRIAGNGKFVKKMQWKALTKEYGILGADEIVKQRKCCYTCFELFV